MRNWISNFWEEVRNSFWFVPALMTLVAIGLSFATIQLDQELAKRWVEAVGWLWAGGAEGAREVLSTIAGSMITVAGVTFSITIVALTLAASQFGPRLLRNFMSDRGNQVVLGTFIATFVYCLLVLRTVRDDGADTFVPYISVNIGLAMALASLGVLIYFIHHVSVSLQAENLVASVFRQLSKMIEHLFPERLGFPPTDDKQPRLPEGFDENARLVCSPANGYVQAIGSDSLVKIACSRQLIVRLSHRPGDFVGEGSVLLQAWPNENCDDQTERQLADTFVIGDHRTATQDVEYSAHQIVEVAVRALSPGLNDPYTTMTCVDWLGAALAQLAQRRIPSIYRYDEEGELRVIAATSTFSELADVAFNQIRQYGSTSVPVVLRMLETIVFVGGQVHRPEDREALKHHANLIYGDGLQSTANQRDRERIELLYRRVVEAVTSPNQGQATPSQAESSDKG